MIDVAKLFSGDLEEILHVIEKKLPDSVWIIPADLKGDLSFISGENAMHRGFTTDEVSKQKIHDIFTQESLELVFKVAAEEKKLEEDPSVDKDRVRTLELEMKCKDGSTIWTENQISFLHDLEGRLSAFLGTTRDISARKLALERQELAIRILECLNNEDNVDEIIEKIVDLIREALDVPLVSFRLLDEKGSLPGCNPDCLCGTVIQGNLDAKFDSKTQNGSIWTDSPRKLIESSRPVDPERLECINSEYKSLALIPIKIHAKAIGLLQMASTESDVFDKETMVFFERIMASIGLAIDRNKTRQELAVKNEQLEHSQRINSIGTLAGGIAHDFNNLLMVILGNAEALTLENPEMPDERRELLSEILNAARRGSELTKQLLAFGRKQVLQKEVIKVNDMFSEFQNILLRLVRADIALKFEFSEETYPIMADKTQIEQIIMNLVVNARDAMPEGGTINVATKNKTVEEDNLVKKEVLKAGRYVSISVSDNGTGIPEKAISKIFEPFFTTKAVDKGSGLGLSVVYGIVRQHGGHILLESKVGEGTTFEILLPAVDKGLVEKQAKEPVKVNEKPNENNERLLDGQRILSVEDDPLVSKVILRILNKAGANVSTAPTVKNAYSIYHEQNGAFDMILSDVALPDGNGVDFVKHIKEIGYKGATLLASGHTFDSDLSGTTERDKLPFIGKPFDPKELVEKISALIKDSKLL